MTIDFLLLRDLTNRQQHQADVALAMSLHPAGKRLHATYLDTTAEDANHAEIVTLREHLADVIDLDAKRGGRA
jgi:hypothetical protein